MKNLFILTLLLFSSAAFAAFTTQDDDIYIRYVGNDAVSDYVHDGQDTAPTNEAPTISLTGASTVNYTTGDTYSELGATCSDVLDGSIVVPAPTFAPTLNMNAAGTYVGTYTCTDSGALTDTAQRNVVVSDPALASYGPQSSNLYIDWDFDFVETFDGLSDWVRTEGRQGNVGASVEPGGAGNIYPNRMPMLADGVTRGAWGYYSQWSYDTNEGCWICAYGDNRVWRGTKSFTLDMSGNEGPSRFGISMGAGYDDVYLFFMVNIPKNMFPTSCEGGSCQNSAVGTYTDGSPYAWFSSFKFVTWNGHCDAEMCSPYSPEWHQIFHIQSYNYWPDSQYNNDLTFHMEDPSHSGDRWVTGYGTSLDSYVGDWFGIELHLTQTDTQTIHDIWIYDQQGNAIQVVNQEAWPTQGGMENLSWNNFFFGGNNSGTYTWGPTMDSSYNIDDVIIDNARIGPKYFSLINQ